MESPIMFTLWGSTTKKGDATRNFPKICSTLKPDENFPWMRERASCQNHDDHNKR